AQHRPERARDVLVQARARRPQQVELWTALAALADQLGKSDEGTQILNEARKRLGDRVELRLAWARWWVDHRNERSRESLSQIEGTAGPFGKLCEATRLIQDAKKGEKEYLAQAQSLLESATAQRPTWPALLLAKADIEDFRGNYENAILNYRRAVELGERNPRVLHRLVDLLCQQQRYDEADQEIRKLQ